MKDEKDSELPGAPPVPSTKAVGAAVTVKKSPKPPADAPTNNQEEDQVVDDVTEEAQDDQLAKQTSEALSQEEKPDKAPKPKSKGGVRQFFRNWWENKKARWATIIIVLLLIVGAAVYPNTRYFMLNTAGVRSSASVIVIDNASRQPLKNVEVKLNNARGITNEDGYVKLDKVRLGSATLIVQRQAFAPLEKKVTVGWGSNPYGEVMLEPKGLQYSFMVTDFLSGKPLEKAEAISGEASAFSDKDGKIILTLDTTSDESVDITIKADGYRDEKLTETAEGTMDKPIKMAPAQEQAFISKRSGKYDLYKIYADGQGETLVLSGTGYERDDIILVPQPNGNNVALVSTRDNQRAADGTLLSTLNIVNLGDNKVKKLDSGDRIQVVGWIENIVVYIVVSEQAPTNGAKKQRLVSYNLDNGQKLDITSATYFNDVIVASDKVFYAPATEATTDAAANNSTSVGFYTSNATGTDIKKLMDQEVWSMIRSNYDTITLSTGKDWYEYKLGGSQVAKISGAPADQKSRVYTNNASNSRSLWVDERDGEGVLISFELSKKEDKVLAGQSGLSYPVRWLNDTTAVYRINNDSETADYVVSLNGGSPKKIVNVTNTSGIDRWYYY